MVLRSASPDGWDHFVGAIREYAAMATTDMLRAGSTDQLVELKGRALGINQLAIMFRDAAKLYEQRSQRNG